MERKSNRVFVVSLQEFELYYDADLHEIASQLEVATCQQGSGMPSEQSSDR